MATVPPQSTALSEVENSRTYTDWPAIFSGAIFAAAFSLIMLAFGSGIGLSLVSAEPGEGVSLRWWAIAAGLWFIWVAVSSFGAGGYLAGRMRRPFTGVSEDEVETRDGMHGLVVWAAGTLIATVLAIGGIGGLMGAAATATGTATERAVDLAETQGDYFADLLLRDDTGTAPSPQAQSAVVTILARGMAEGEVRPADRDRLLQIAAAETNMQPEEVEQRVDQALNTFEQARQDAIEAAEQARILGLIIAFIVAATMMLSAAVAYFAAILGGSHRNYYVPIRRLTLRREL